MGATATTASLAWDFPAGASGAVSYSVLKNGVATSSGTNNYSISGLTPNTGYMFTINASDAGGHTSNSTQSLTITTGSSAPLPAGWQSSDLGSVSITGGVAYQNNQWTVAGSGADIWGTADQFRFALPLWREMARSLGAWIRKLPRTPQRRRES